MGVLTHSSASRSGDVCGLAIPIGLQGGQGFLDAIRELQRDERHVEGAVAEADEAVRQSEPAKAMQALTAQPLGQGKQQAPIADDWLTSQDRWARTGRGAASNDLLHDQLQRAGELGAACRLDKVDGFQGQFVAGQRVRAVGQRFVQLGSTPGRPEPSAKSESSPKLARGHARIVGDRRRGANGGYAPYQA
jgi:hypothetical protein